jgi:serine phosphatase RsbU (regulator of sigma subunit)
MSAKEMLNAVLNDVSSFLGKVPQQDDQTLVVVRIDGKNGWAQKHPD